MDTGKGFYFRTEDYATISRRLLIDVIDFLTVGVLCAGLTLFLWGSVPNDVLVWCWFAFFFCYFVVLKKSTFGTLGYRVAGVRIVGLDGQPPSLWNLTVRMMFIFLGPVNYLMDLIWLSGDPLKQALRDKFAQTYVVKKRADPIGSGEVVHRQYYFLGCSFLFREIKVESGSGPAS